jgi:hypothetical protein
MEPQELVDAVFSIDKNIRYVGVTGLGLDCGIKASRMREGVKSLTPERKDEDFLQVIPEIILGIVNKLEDDLGKIRYSLLCFQRLALMLFKTPEYVVVLSLEAGTFARPIYERIRLALDLKQYCAAT